MNGIMLIVINLVAASIKAVTITLILYIKLNPGQAGGLGLEAKTINPGFLWSIKRMPDAAAACYQAECYCPFVKRFEIFQMGKMRQYL
jgi:hypothetical protein